MHEHDLLCPALNLLLRATQLSKQCPFVVSLKEKHVYNLKNWPKLMKQVTTQERHSEIKCASAWGC